MSSIAAVQTPKENENSLVQEIPLDRVRPSAANPRGKIDASSLAELAASIQVHGVLQPILVRPAPTFGYEIICGERRWRASLKAKRETIPARVVSLSNGEALEYATVENILREGIHPLEEAASYEKLVAMNPGFTPAIVGEHVGKSASHVQRRLQLLKLDPKLKKYFLDGQMTAAHALILARLQPRDQAEVISQLNQAGQKGAIEFPSVARLQEWVETEIYLDLNGAPFNKDDTGLLPEAGACATCPKPYGLQPDAISRSERERPVHRSGMLPA